MKIVSSLFLILIILFGIIFACLNSEPVVINYSIGQNTLPLSLLLVFTFSIGGMAGLVAGTVMYLKLKSKNRRLKSRIKLAEKELSNLRTMPLQDNR